MLTAFFIALKTLCFLRVATLQHSNLKIFRPDHVSKFITIMHHDSTTNYTGLPVCAMMTEGETCNPRRNINCKDDIKIDNDDDNK